MGRITQLFDYLKRDPAEFGKDFVLSNYTHIEITPELKKLRKTLKWYRKPNKK